MNIETETYLKAMLIQEEKGINKTFRLLMIVYETLRKIRCEQSVKKFLVKEGLIK